MFSPDTRESVVLMDEERGDVAHLRTETNDIDVKNMISHSEDGDSEDDVTTASSSNSTVNDKTENPKVKAPTKVQLQSMDFEVTESYAWRMHQTRRFYHDIGNKWTHARRTTAMKWVLVVVIG